MQRVYEIFYHVEHTHRSESLEFHASQSRQTQENVKSRKAHTQKNTGQALRS